jgi:hypothetical protein
MTFTTIFNTYIHIYIYIYIYARATHTRTNAHTHTHMHTHRRRRLPCSSRKTCTLGSQGWRAMTRWRRCWRRRRQAAEGSRRASASRLLASAESLRKFWNTHSIRAYIRKLLMLTLLHRAYASSSYSLYTTRHLMVASNAVCVYIYMYWADKWAQVFPCGESIVASRLNWSLRHLLDLVSLPSVWRFKEAI